MTERSHRGNGADCRITRAALALAAALAVGGCAPTFKALNTPYVLTVPVDAKGCPGKPRFDVNCGAGKEDCAHLRHGHSVSAVSEPPGKPFALQFDPFGGSRIDVDGQAGRPPLTIGPNAKLGTYTFIVVGQPGCPVADPQIILE